MEEYNNDIYGLIVRSLRNEATPEEIRLLEAWKAESETNMMEYIDYETILMESGKLASPLKINLEKSLTITHKKGGIEKRQNQWLPLLLQAAAVLVLALLFSTLYHYFEKSKLVIEPEKIVFQEVKSTFGIQSRVELADGSVVYLNSGSSLRFPSSFTGKNSREVFLEGEGFFSVAGNKEKPFIVNAQLLRIEATGTRFNVDAYNSNEEINVVLIEGEIKLQQEISSGKADLVSMNPGEVARFSSKQKSFRVGRETDMQKYYAWTEGKILFSNDPIQVVVRKLSNWYNVDIEIVDKKLERYRFTGTFIDEPLDQVLHLLNISSGMRYSIEPAKKLTDNTYTKRRIILKSK